MVSNASDGRHTLFVALFAAVLLSWSAFESHGPEMVFGLWSGILFGLVVATSLVLEMSGK